MNRKTSKPIGQSEDESKEFIIESLKGDNTKGFDIDSIYYSDSQWIVFEYLKCESEYVSPHSSHPKKYPWNWKKFKVLYSLTKKLEGKLYLVNYSTREKDKDQVKVMEVKNYDHNKIEQWEKSGRSGHCDYMEIKETKMSREEFSKSLRELNENAELPKV